MDAVIAQAEQLTAPGDAVAIHFDANAPKAEFERLKAGLAGNPLVVFPKRRVKCGWGEWSLIAATLEALKARCRG